MNQQRKKIIPANPVTFLVELNEVMITNVRKGQNAQLTLPSLFDRAFVIVHEAGVIPIIETAVVEE